MISYLGRQIFAGQNRLIEAYKDATRIRNGYLMIDLSPRQVDDSLRLRTNIITGAEYCTIYLPR